MFAKGEFDENDKGKEEERKSRNRVSIFDNDGPTENEKGKKLKMIMEMWKEIEKLE